HFNTRCGPAVGKIPAAGPFFVHLCHPCLNTSDVLSQNSPCFRLRILLFFAFSAILESTKYSLPEFWGERGGYYAFCAPVHLRRSCRSDPGNGTDGMQRHFPA